MTGELGTGGLRSVRLAGYFTPGRPLERQRNELIDVPLDLANDEDELYRVVERGIPAQNIRPDDLLVVEPRPNGNAAAGELVLAEHDGCAYVGRWWTKRGRRALMDDVKVPIVEGRGVQVVGAVALIARGLWS